MHEHQTLTPPFPKRPQCPDCGIELAVISEVNYLLPKTSQTEEARVASAFDLASIMLAKHEIAMLLASDINTACSSLQEKLISMGANSILQSLFTTCMTKHLGLYVL